MEQHELLATVVNCLESLGVRYLVTGSVASMAYGEPRLTNDIDVVADLKDQHVAELVGRFPAPDFYVSEDAVRRAIERRHQFNIIHPASGLKADVIIPEGDEFDESRFARARRLAPTAGTEAAFASPEDVILKKLLYYQEGGSEKHLRDIAGVLKVSPEALDLAYLADWAEKLNVGEEWRVLLARLRIQDRET
jgi:hypothetical protein